MNTYKLKIPINKNNRGTRRDMLNSNIMINLYFFIFLKFFFEEFILYLDIELKKYILFGNYYFYYFI